MKKYVKNQKIKMYSNHPNPIIPAPIVPAPIVPAPIVKKRRKNNV